MFFYTTGILLFILIIKFVWKIFRRQKSNTFRITFQFFYSFKNVNRQKKTFFFFIHLISSSKRLIFFLWTNMNLIFECEVWFSGYWTIERRWKFDNIIYVLFKNMSSFNRFFCNICVKDYFLYIYQQSFFLIQNIREVKCYYQMLCSNIIVVLPLFKFILKCCPYMNN